jgi:hypothetical protein
VQVASHDPPTISRMPTLAGMRRKLHRTCSRNGRAKIGVNFSRWLSDVSKRVLRRKPRREIRRRRRFERHSLIKASEALLTNFRRRKGDRVPRAARWRMSRGPGGPRRRGSLNLNNDQLLNKKFGPTKNSPGHRGRPTHTHTCARACCTVFES